MSFRAAANPSYLAWKRNLTNTYLFVMPKDHDSKLFVISFEYQSRNQDRFGNRNHQMLLKRVLVDNDFCQKFIRECWLLPTIHIWAILRSVLIL